MRGERQGGRFAAPFVRARSVLVCLLALAAMLGGPETANAERASTPAASPTSNANGSRPAATTTTRAATAPKTLTQPATDKPANKATPLKTSAASKKAAQAAPDKPTEPGKTAPNPAATSTQRGPSQPAAGAAAPTKAKRPTPSPTATQFELSLRRLTQQIEQLRTRQLDPSIEARTLFDVDLDDEHALQLEASRLRLLLNQPGGDAGVRAVVDRADEWQQPTVGDAGTRRAPAAAHSWTKGELAARLRLDKARLAFYSLPLAQRKALREAHQQRQLEGNTTQVEQQAGEAAERAKEAERQRQEALEAAQNARTEALRLVAEEQARLLGVTAAQAQFEAQLLERRSQLNTQQETTLTWQRRVREMLERAQRHAATAAEVGELYTSLRSHLRAAREDLARALSGALGDTQVPGPGPDRTAELPADVDASALRTKWGEVAEEERRLAQLEHQFLTNQAQASYEQVRSLNQDRLALYPYLSDQLRSEIVGFGPRGMDQARAELRQVVLTARHRLFEATRWLTAVEVAGGARNESALAVFIVAVKWLAPIGVFIWWRRRSELTIRSWREAARTERRLDRSVTHSSLEKGLAFLQLVHRPLESLVLSFAVISLLPTEAQNRLEVQLLATILYWSFGGAFVVTAIDALAGRPGARRIRDSQLQTAHVRLRSLRLLGRVVVVVALILSLTSEIVGKGTIYDWVLSTCWFAAIPVVLVITRWWRDIIFERLERRRKKPPLAQWALQQTGYKSLLVALGAGAFLLYEGVSKTVKPLVTDFDLTKRLLAYLFRRDLSKRTETTEAAVAPLPKKLYTSLGPSTPSAEIVASIADAQVSEVIERINRPGGGVFALVGERGSGKTTILRRIATEGRDAHLVKCPLDASELDACVVRGVHLEEGTSLEAAVAAVNSSDRNAGLLIDDAHRLVKPKMGGLAEFDEFIDLASRHSQYCAWVFAFDEVMWSFLERARGAKPMFDDVIELKPWGEDGIAELLKSRSRQTDIDPDFSGLIGTLPADADEVDRQEAIARTATGYQRLIWDYASGNPGIALHTWRRSLAQNEDGQVVVRNFHVPDVRELEALPDPPVFVLRAIVQLEFASVADLVEATRLHRAAVDTALRFASVRGYVELRGDRYWITWAWFRPITRFLERRHLLAKK